MFGVFRQRVASGGSRLLRGFGEEFPVPVSRHTEIRAADLPAEAGLTVLASSAESGLCLLEDRDHRAVYMFNHLEYDAETLRDEFLRDRRAGKPVEIPRDYFPERRSRAGAGEYLAAPRPSPLRQLARRDLPDGLAPPGRRAGHSMGARGLTIGL